MALKGSINLEKNNNPTIEQKENPQKIINK